MLRWMSKLHWREVTVALGLLAAACSGDGGGSGPLPDRGLPSADLAAPAPDAPPGADRGLATNRCLAGEELLARVDPARMLADLEHLVGLGERRTLEGQTKAAAYLRGQLAGLAGVTVEEHRYSYLGASFVNLIVDIAGSERPDELVMAGAHYDSNSDDQALAPGADDNASGTVAVLEAARVLAGCAPRRGIRLLFFSNEERGLIGSSAYVTQLKAVLPREKMLGLINVDMIGYGPADEDLDLATKPAYRSLAEEMAAAVAQHTALRTKLIVSDHCG